MRSLKSLPRSPKTRALKVVEVPALTHLQTAKGDRGGDTRYPLIVHSHLGWDWVWQRPQQFLSRLSKRHRVLFVEGPAPVEGISESQVTLHEVPDFPKVIVVRMKMPAAKWSDGAWVDDERRRLLKSVLAGPLGKKFERPVQWFYDPMAVTSYAGRMQERANVYDCMDQLAQFRGAPPELVNREREFLATADVVFAGGPKIHKEKSRFHSNCHSFGCGADVAHFGKALLTETIVPEEIAALPGPVFGYFGVVDERIDYELVAALADANPAGSVVMVGPWTKVDRAAFPERANLHWLGGKDYTQLPAFAKRFDVCLMPFALNEATEFINPTKALEYMASGRPIVSTAVEDVVLQFSNVVKVGRTREEFVAACLESAARPDRAAVKRGMAMAGRNTWEAIIRKMKRHIAEVLETKQQMETTAA